MLTEQNNIIQLPRQEEVLFKVAIIDRDSLSSCLLVNALAHSLKCHAIPVQPSDALQVCRGSKVDLAIISSHLDSRPEGGFELASRLVRAHPETHILLILSQSTSGAVIRAFQSGAQAVLNRQESLSGLLDCVERLKNGSIWAGREESKILLEVLRCIPFPAVLTQTESNPLSKRELQVARCAAKGMKNRAIASELRLSQHTVKNYLFRAFEKLGISSRSELLFYLTSQGQSFGPLSASSQKSSEAKLGYIDIA